MNKLKNINFNIYEFLTIKIIKGFENHINLTDLDKDKLYFGTISILINIIKGALICLIAVLLGIFSEVLIMTIIIASLRFTASGLHAKSSFICTLTTLVVYIGGAFLSRYFSINFKVAFIICIILTFFLYRYAPADTENRPIIGEKRRKKLKVQTLITVLFLLVSNLLIFNKLLINLTLIAMMFQTIAILPLTYRLLKRSWGNYERYEN